MDAELRTEALEWFVDRDIAGSQSSFLKDALPRAADEISGDIGVHRDTLRPVLERLRAEGLIATHQGDGRYRGAMVTAITQRGRDTLYQRDDASRLVDALGDLAAALRESGDDEEALHVEQAIGDAVTIKSGSDRISAVLSRVPAAVQTTAAVKPAWNSVVQVARVFGIHGLPEIP